MFPPLRTTGDIPSFSKDAFHDESPTYPSPHTLFFPLDFKYNKGERVCICGASLTDQVPLGISHTLNIFNFLDQLYEVGIVATTILLMKK